MRQFILSFIGVLALAGVALWSAQSKVHDYSSLEALQVGLAVADLDF